MPKTVTITVVEKPPVEFESGEALQRAVDRLPQDSAPAGDWRHALEMSRELVRRQESAHKRQTRKTTKRCHG